MIKQPLKIIIDTDAGDDVDDILAVSLALKSPEVKIMGITTVFKNTVARARMVKYLLEVNNEYDIDVYPGIGLPLYANRKLNMNDIPSGYIPEMDNMYVRKDVSAVDYIIDTVRKYPGEIILVPIGELTNIATAMRKAPDIAEKIKHINMMQGTFFSHMVEWNVVCDVEAAGIVFNSDVKKYAIGTDVTVKCILSEENINRIFNRGTAFTEALSMFIRAFKKSWPEKYVILHDPLALSSVYNDSFLKFKPVKVEIIKEPGKFFGMTLNISDFHYYNKRIDKTPNCMCASDVDNTGFIAHFVERILK